MENGIFLFFFFFFRDTRTRLETLEFLFGFLILFFFFFFHVCVAASVSQSSRVILCRYRISFFSPFCKLKRMNSISCLFLFSQKSCKENVELNFSYFFSSRDRREKERERRKGGKIDR